MLLRDAAGDPLVRMWKAAFTQAAAASTPSHRCVPPNAQTTDCPCIQVEADELYEELTGDDCGIDWRRSHLKASGKTVRHPVSAAVRAL